jgi:hypothetical protein
MIQNINKNNKDKIKLENVKNNNFFDVKNINFKEVIYTQIDNEYFIILINNIYNNEIVKVIEKTYIDIIISIKKFFYIVFNLKDSKNNKRLLYQLEKNNLTLNFNYLLKLLENNINVVNLMIEIMILENKNGKYLRNIQLLIKIKNEANIYYERLITLINLFFNYVNLCERNLLNH